MSFFRRFYRRRGRPAFESIQPEPPTQQRPVQRSIEELQAELHRQMTEPVRGPNGRIIAPPLTPNGGGHEQVRLVYEYFTSQLRALADLLRKGDYAGVNQWLQNNPELLQRLTGLYEREAGRLRDATGAHHNPFAVLANAADQLLGNLEDRQQQLSGAAPRPMPAPVARPTAIPVRQPEPVVPPPAVLTGYRQWYRVPGTAGRWTTVPQPQAVGDLRVCRTHADVGGLQNLLGGGPLELVSTPRGGWYAERYRPPASAVPTAYGSTRRPVDPGVRVPPSSGFSQASRARAYVPPLALHRLGLAGHPPHATGGMHVSHAPGIPWPTSRQNGGVPTRSPAHG